MNEIAFEAVGIEKTYFSNEALAVLKGVDLSLRQGEIIAIEGASGTGKTTLLHILGCLDRPSGGKLLFGGKDVFRKNDSELSHFRNRTVGFVFQFHHLLPEFTALENVMMPGLIAGKKKMDLSDAAMDLLDKVGLMERGGHRVGELSGGEQQRVALARALINDPLLLLADEPTGNLDPKTGMKVFQLIREINSRRPLTTVIVTHNYELAAEMDRRYVLADGRLREREVLDSEKNA